MDRGERERERHLSLMTVVVAIRLSEKVFAYSSLQAEASIKSLFVV